MGLLFASELGPRPGSRAFIEGGKVRVHEPLAHALNRGDTDIECGSYLVVGQAISRFEQDTRPRNFSSRFFATPDDMEQVLSLIGS
jgi:hypothetical protein